MEIGQPKLSERNSQKSGLFVTSTKSEDRHSILSEDLQIESERNDPAQLPQLAGH